MFKLIVCTTLTFFWLDYVYIVYGLNLDYFTGL